MRTFYVRPDRDAGYGQGDGSTYQDAWNGLKSVDWQSIAGEPALIWVCGDAQPGGFVTLCVEWSYLGKDGLPARPDPRREPALAV